MDWTKGLIIGRGSSATVNLATTASGQLFAVKSTHLSTSHFLRKEQHFLSQLRSPYIIDYIGFDVDYADNVPIYNLFMEYASGGTISDVIKKQGGSLDECLIRSYTRRILLGLDHLHSNNLVHCDIKCQNLLVGDNGVKIGDLGCAKLGDNGGVTTSVPEVARGEEQGFAADIWSLGCAVIEMATGSNPWPEVNNPVSGLYKIGFSGEVPLFPTRLSVEAKDFLDKCLRVNGEERWAARELLQHPFVDFDSGLEKIETFPKKDSPTSMLDQGFWDSLEVSDPAPATTQLVEISGKSPAERIRQLVEAGPSCLPNWEEEEEWMTVRKNEKILQHDLLRDEDEDEDEDDESESTRGESFLVLDVYAEEEVSISRMMVGSRSVGVSDSRFIDYKNRNINDTCLIIHPVIIVFFLSSYYNKNLLWHKLFNQNLCL